MLLLVSTSDKLQVITGSAGTIDVHASWMDNVSGAVQPGRTNTNISTAATTDVVGSPAATTQRNIKTLHIRNRGAAPNVITVQHTDGTTISQLHRTTLNPETTLQYVDEIGFIILGLQTTSATGDLKPTHKIVADPGWIMWIDGTIGDATSGSSILANAITQDLFALYYNNYTDTNCPVLTSAGVTTTRGSLGTAAAAFSAHARMSLPPASGRVLGIAGSGPGLTVRTAGQTVGVEATTPSIATMASHQHGPQDPPIVQLIGTPNFATNNWEPFGSAHLASAATSFVGGSQPISNMQPTTFINVMVKL